MLAFYVDANLRASAHHLSSLFETTTMITDGQPSLYAPEAFAAKDPVALVRRYPFALIVTTAPNGIFATSTPMFFETDASDAVLIGHMSRRNAHATTLAGGQQALAVFSGPHTYVSSSWYEARPTVPTWNYVIAHVRGTVEPVDDAEGSLEILRRTATMAERGSPEPWTLEQAPEGRVSFLLPMIRCFRLLIERVEGVTKLNQTHPESDRLRVVRHLLDRGDAASAEIARMMMHVPSG